MKKTIALLLIFSFLFASCSLNNSSSFSCKLFYLSTEKNSGIVEKKVKFKSDSIEDAIKKAFSELSSPPSSDYRALLSETIKLNEVSFSNQTCTLTLSEEYLEFSGYSKSMINMCIVKTISSFPDINRVKIICEDESFEFNESDFLLSAPRTYYDSFSANLYYTSIKSSMLIPESRKIVVSPETSLESNVLNSLLTGPVSRELESPIPKGTSINSINTNDGICTIDLSSEFIKNFNHTQLNECLAIYSIVNTMTELPNIDSVFFLVEGQPCDSFLYFDLTQPIANTSENFSQ